MNAQKCASCKTALKGLFLRCCRCADNHHYTCVNFTKKDFEGFKKEFKETWICPPCCRKEPKVSDNTNTKLSSLAVPTAPVKLSACSPSQQFDNVTLRSRPRSTSTGTCDCLSADLIREIIREELDRKFDTDIVNIHNKIGGLEEALALSNSERDSIKIESEALKCSIADLTTENIKLRDSYFDLSKRLLQVEQLSRANNIELQCVPEHKNENLINTVQQIGNIIKCPVTDSEIHYCNRIAKLNAGSPRPRSILVRFGSRRLRDTFLAGVIKFNKNNPGDKLNSSHLGQGGKKTAVFVSEHLNPETKALHAAARLKAKELNYRYVWVRDGKVFLRKNDSSTFVLVKDHRVLSDLK